MNSLLWFSVILFGFVTVQNTNSQSCPVNHVNQCGSYANVSSDVLRLGIVADIHTRSQNGQPCSQIVKRNVEMAEAIKWVFDQLNSRNFIPGVTLDTVVLDSCSREDVAIHELVSIFPNMRQPSCQPSVHGVISLVSSSVSQSLAKSLGKAGIPLISPTSSAQSLSNRSKYPTFFRTIPSATSEVKALFNLVKELGMQYLALVHSEDAYGMESADEFELLTRDTICIGGKFSVGDPDIISKLIRLSSNTRNLPLVYVGNYEGAESLLVTTTTDLFKEVRQRFLWVFSGNLGINTDIFTRNTKIRRNVVSVFPHSIDVHEFTDYWTDTLVQYLQLNSSYPHQWYFQEYIFNLLKCSSNSDCFKRGDDNIIQRYKQTPFLNMALDSAYIYAYAFKNMHTTLCNRQQGLCRAMQQEIGDLVETITTSSFVYDDSTFPFLPTYLKNSTRTVGFLGGDLTMTDPSYTIYNSRCDQRTGVCELLQVGNMTGDHFNLQKQEIQFFLTPTTNEPTRADLLLPIYCERNCDVCESTNSHGIPFASIWGEFLIVSFFTATLPGADAFGCTDEILVTESVDVLESMLYAVDAFNGVYNHSDEILVNGRPGLSGKLGIIAFNDCRNPLYAGQLLSNWLTKKIELKDSAGRYYDPEKCVAVIGGSFSSINLRLLPITRAENLLQVSATATSVQLEFNGSFLRTIPADDVQVQVMIDFVKRLGSNAVSIVYQDDSYGIKGYEELQKKTLEAEICISVAVKIPVNIQDNEVHDVLDRLRLGRPTRIVILFTVWRETLTILKIASTRASNKEFVWIGTESWGMRPVLLSDITDPEALGSFTVLVPTENSTKFSEYLATRDPRGNTRNPFFRSWWEKVHNCQLPSQTIPNPPNRCPSGLSLHDQPLDLYADLVRKAIWSIGIGLAKTVNTLCRSSMHFCPAVRTSNGLQELVKNVKQVEMTVSGEKRRLYTSRGDGNVDEVILNVQREANKPVYKQVARLNRSKGFIITANYTFYSEDGSPVPVPFSTCTLCNCIFKHKNDPLIHLSKYIKREGVMYLAAVLPVHSSTKSYEVSVDGIVSLEALLSAVDNANSKMGQQLGLIIYDSYGNPDLTDWQLVSLVNSGKYLGLEQYNINNSMIVAFLTHTDQKLATRKTVTNDDIIHIDLGKNWPYTSNEANYQFSMGYDVHSEISAIVSFLVYHGWLKVQLLCSTTVDSEEACDLIQRMFKNHSICVFREQTLEKTTYQTLAGNVLSEVATSGTKVVVSLVEQEDVAPFMDALGAVNVRKSIPYPVFIGWSRFTKGVTELSGTYKDVCNNSVGFQETLPTLSGDGQLVLQAIKNGYADSKRNPWLTRDIAHVLQTADLTPQYGVIEDTVDATNILTKALKDLLSSECGGQNGLCPGLIKLSDWRKRLFKNVNNEFRKVARQKTVFDVVTFITDEAPNAPYMINKIGEYFAANRRIRLNSPYILRNVSSGCELNQCDFCKLEHSSDPFSAWGIAFLVIVPLLLIIIAILLALIIRETLKRRRDLKEIYLKPHTITQNKHWKPPPLPYRENKERLSHPVTSLYSPGASERSATSFISASSSHPSDDMHRKSSGASFQRNPPASRIDRDGSHTNPAFSQNDESSQAKYSMSLSVMPPEDDTDQPITYGHLQFENGDSDFTRNGGYSRNQTRPTVHASGPITPTAVSLV